LNKTVDEKTKNALERKKRQFVEKNIPPIGVYVVTELINEISRLVNRSPGQGMVPEKIKDSNYREKYDLSINVHNNGMMDNFDLSDIGALKHIKLADKVGPYINIGIDEQSIGTDILNQVLDLGEKYGTSSDGDPKVVIIDYSSPNIAKKMTVAHLRSTIIGQSLMNLQEAVGNISFGINHIGDWGSQFGGIFYMYFKHMEENAPLFQQMIAENPANTLLEIYREYNKESKDNPEMVETARTLWRKMEEGDTELTALWQQFREWSLEEFAGTYGRLGIEFDAIQGESFYEDKMTDVLQEAIKQGVLKYDEDDSIILPSQTLIDGKGNMNDKIMLGKDNLPKGEILQKPNGGSVYLTRDLAAIRYRACELGADEVYYVIGKEQGDHCIKLFNMAKQLGYFALSDVRHISFGHLNVDGRKMKSREGQVVMLDDLMDSAIDSARRGIQERRADIGAAWTESDEARAKAIGISALIFDDLRQSYEKDMEFNFNIAEKIVDSGSVKIQYTHARLRKLIEENDDSFIDRLVSLPAEISPQEKNILTEVMWFPVVVKEAADKASPHKVAAYLTELARVVNSFYESSLVSRATDENTKVFRINLVKAAKQVMENAARLLHIELPGEI